MPKKTTLLIIVLAIITGLLLFLALVSTQKDTKPAAEIPERAEVEKTARVYFVPQSFNLNTNQGSVDIMVDTGGGDITGVQAEMQYDPEALANVSLQPDLDQASFFGSRAVVLFNDIDIPTPGRISFVIAINTGDAPRKGNGRIATLNFEKAPRAASESTQINFLDKTLVTKLGVEESVLKETIPLLINLSQSASITPRVTTAPIVTSGAAQ